MAFALDFSICVADSCDQLQFCDDTCDYNPSNPSECCDGYAIIDDGEDVDAILRSEVISTRFNWVMPDGTAFLSRDHSFVPAQYAQVSVTFSAGVPGDWVVAILDDISLGSAIYIDSLAQMIRDLVNNINLNSDVTGWRAMYSGSVVYVIRTDSGTEWNGLQMELTFNVGTALVGTFVSDITAGANDSDGCFTITVPELYGQGNCPEGLCCWPIGVYTLTYIIRNEAGVELARKQKKFLVDCLVRNCIYNHIKILTGDDCSCDTDKAWEKVLKLKETLEAIQEEFACGMYDCANEHLQDLYEECKSMCLDC